jgi:hypothetical protein
VGRQPVQKRMVCKPWVTRVPDEEIVRVSSAVSERLALEGETSQP